MDGREDMFPKGLRVLVVDDNPTCLKILERLLQNCNYEVTITTEAIIGLQVLRENKDNFDILISDVHMPKMDGFGLLQHVGLELDIPVIMLSANDDPRLVMKGVKHGAVDYLLKPVRTEELKNIWQHVVRKKQMKKKMGKLVSASTTIKDGPVNTNLEEIVTKKRKDQINNEDDAEKGRSEEEGIKIDSIHLASQKKSRVVWSPELHKQFAIAVDQLGPDKAFPKKILDLMNVEGLTRENVASHLQKYRLYLKRLNATIDQPTNATSNPFGIQESIYLNGRFSKLCSLEAGVVGKSSIGMSSTTSNQTSSSLSQPTSNIGKSLLQNKSLSSYNSSNNNNNRSAISILSSGLQNKEVFSNKNSVMGPPKNVGSQVVGPLADYARYLDNWKSSTLGRLPTQQSLLNNNNQLSSSNFNNRYYSIDVPQTQSAFECTFPNASNITNSLNASVKEGQDQDSLIFHNVSYNIMEPEGWRQNINDITNTSGGFNNYLMIPTISSSDQIIGEDSSRHVSGNNSVLMQNIEENDVDGLIVLERNNYFLEDSELLTGFTQDDGCGSLDDIVGEIPNRMMGSGEDDQTRTHIFLVSKHKMIGLEFKCRRVLGVSFSFSKIISSFQF